jgi:hypothetical protein
MSIPVGLWSFGTEILSAWHLSVRREGKTRIRMTAECHSL